MTVQPKYHWQFAEREGNIARDTISGGEGRFHRIVWNGHGRIGNAVRFASRESRINLGNVVGQFGTSDFTVAFGIKILGTDDQNDLDIIGNRSVSGHGNWFSLRLQGNGKILTFEVDESSRGKHYAVAKTRRLSILPNKKWHHIAVVREGQTIKLYFNGALVAEGASSTGVANINSDINVRLGHYTRHTPTAQYEDLRIYHTALNTAQIQTLIPPINQRLNAGEIELVAIDNAAIILNQDAADLSRFSGQFQKLRLGPDTGATLYKGTNFGSVAQKLYADIPEIRFTKLGGFPRSVHIWPTVGEPFTGKWIIKTPNGQYLSRRSTSLVTAPHRLLDELFSFHYNPNYDQPQLIPVTDQEGLLLKVDNEAAVLLVDDSESHKDAFSIVGTSLDQWLKLNQNDTFSWTQAREDRSVFFRVAKMADNEGQVGELVPGEVALYEHRAYHGRTWILTNSENDVAGNYISLQSFHGLDNQISSIRLGPKTGVTLFRNEDNQVADANREEEIEDMVENTPDLKETQVGDDAVSSIKIFKTIDSEDVFTSYTTKLSQDYRMVGNALEEFSSYRTTLRFEPGAGEIEVSATDLTTIEVEGTTHEIDEVRSVMLSPNELNFIMITSEADGLNTPELKIRTSEMALNERVVIFPNQEAHQQIAELEDGALWNATDAQGNLIVDRNAHSKEEVASVQNTIKRVMGTVTYVDDASVVRRGSAENSRVVDRRTRAQISNRVISGATIDNPWELKFKPDSNNSQLRSARTVGGAANISQLQSASATDTLIQETEVSQDEFMQLLKQAEQENSSATVPPDGSSRILRFRVFRKIKNAVKKAVSVVVGTVKDIVHVIVKTAEGIIDFVIDTAEKVADFIEAVVEKVVNGIKKFIEFLQFLFNWDDILDTQRYLVSAINAGFDYATQQVEAVKAPVSAFIDNLQDTVEKGMNQLVKALGAEPSEVRKSGFKLPEAAEWFFSKLLGGSKQDDANTTPNSVTQPSGDSELENFVFHFTEAFEDGAGAVLRGFEGMGETITTLITNPLQPQLALVVLIETFRDVTIQMLESIENLVLGFLDVIAEAVEQIQNLLNAEIKIPFISDLFKLIGAGKLTLLNLAGLLLAIPVTVVSKIVMGKAPFKNEPPLDFSTQTNDRLVVEPRAIAARADTTARERSIRIWGIIGLTADALNGLINAGLDASAEFSSKEKELEEKAGYGLEILSLALSGFSWLASFPSSPDFPGGRPYNVAAHKVTQGEDKPEYEERVMWGWRTFMYWLDVVILANKGIAVSRGDKAKLQRLRRAEPKTIGFFFVASILDAIYAIQYLAATPKEDKSGFESANEVVSWIPNLLAPIRTIGPKSAKALAVLDFVAMAVNTGLGSKLLADDLAEL
ncbi:MAG: hypothetical protein F6K19_29630 [Cyanothece sp. SIO1E1]|nr:hypothetical protein [Cyanothece sp. SIO1E1]